jgi:uncharacterized phage protein (TIGR01671 family)
MSDMREIKFRAWNGKMEKMFSAEDMAEDQMTLLPTGQFINVSSESTKLSIIYPLDAMLPLQYTGLKDKNGKEIYEGDIVKVPQFPRPLFVKWDYNGYHLFENICNEASLGGVEDEVIGNIYENPELLK